MVTRGNQSTPESDRISLVVEPGAFQEIVIARRIEGNAAHPARVHNHVVVVPEIDVRQIFRKNLLHLRVQLLAHVLVKFAARLVDKRIHLRIGVKAAVGAVRRELGGVEDVFEDVGIFVAADPAQ